MTSEVREALIMSLVDVIGHDDWCHGSRCTSCPPCTWEMNDCSVWTTAERVTDAVILFYSRLQEDFYGRDGLAEAGHARTCRLYRDIFSRCDCGAWQANRKELEARLRKAYTEGRT